ncbi:MAG TPA: hypothetical protein ENF42_04780 [Candidatus Bathyarchaeota archaeon]|nr:hypothetical protein [Candidatus Bathyarchaeota archaeon]
MSKHPQKDSIRMKIVYPGKHIGIIEEGTPGKNTYEVDGNIYSSVIGRLNYDKDNREFRVRPFKEPNYVSAGYVILGTISATGLTSAKVEIEAIYRPKIKILGKPLEGYIFKRKESNWMFAVTDIILAKVLRIVFGRILLTINKPELGVIYSRCPECTMPLKRVGNTLVCGECEKIVMNKKLSPFYSKLSITRK